MRKQYLVITIFIALVTGSLVFALTRSEKPDTANAASVSTVAQPTDTTTPAATTVNTNGTYANYSESAVAAAKGQRVLFFHAPWCYQCQELDKDLAAKGAPDGYDVFKVDYDSNQALRQKYGITFRTAFIKIDANGNAVDKEYIAYKEPSLAAVTRDYLQ